MLPRSPYYAFVPVPPIVAGTVTVAVLPAANDVAGNRLYSWKGAALPPENRNSWYVRRSVSNGATPESFHETVKVEPPTTWAPGAGDVKTTSQREAGSDERRSVQRVVGTSAARMIGGGRRDARRGATETTLDLVFWWGETLDNVWLIVDGNCKNGCGRYSGCDQQYFQWCLACLVPAVDGGRWIPRATANKVPACASVFICLELRYICFLSCLIGWWLMSASRLQMAEETLSLVVVGSLYRKTRPSIVILMSCILWLDHWFSRPIIQSSLSFSHTIFAPIDDFFPRSRDTPFIISIILHCMSPIGFFSDSR